MQTLIHAPLITLIRVCNSYISSKKLACTSVVGNCPQTSPLRYHYTLPEHDQDSCPWVSQGSFLSLFLVGFKSASYIQIIRESLSSDNINNKFQDTSYCSEMRPLPAARQQNQNENLTLTAAGDFNIFIQLVHCSSRLVSVSMSSTDFMHL